MDGIKWRLLLICQEQLSCDVDASTLIQVQVFTKSNYARNTKQNTSGDYMNQLHKNAKPLKTKTLKNGCKICVSHKTNVNGYPRFYRNGKLQLISRYLWIEKYGVIDKNLEIMHKCDNPKCINLDHLMLGTHDDNMKDSMNKARQTRGIHNSQTKLTEKKVRIIRKSKLSGRALARKYGVNHATIQDVINRKNWKYVED